MRLILISLVVGIIIGLLGIIPKKYMKFNSRFQQIGVVLLLFSMGASIGSNKELILNIKILGLKAVTFALFTCLFSIIFTYITTSIFLSQSMEETKK